MNTPRAYVLNYDAERELSGQHGAKVPRAVRPSWMATNDLVVGQGSDAASDVPGHDGVAWCPTPSALAALTQAGVTRLPYAPAVAVLRKANARETFADLHPLVEFGARVAKTEAEAQVAVARPAPDRPSGKAPTWLLRQSLVASGQGRLLADEWSANVATWTQRALRFGPVHVMPMVDISEEFAAHAFLFHGGEVQLGAPVTQVVSGAAWRSAVRRDGPVIELTAALSSVVQRLQALGYVGPVGVDGFTWQDAAGATHVAAGTDVNARYTMSMGAAFDAVPYEVAP